ncbi:MAG TPA: phytanoyl-CoA dioxygenase family protein [Gaiellaceae bacterium]|nr:phytanoyl-CoA dioxygenase family protein [Gaiellaceae bacterium]
MEAGTAAITTTEEALAALGATEDVLSPEDYAFLDENGYLVLPNVVDADWLEGLRARISELQALEGETAGSEVPKQEGVDMLGNLFDKGEVFERMLRVPQVLAASHHVLRNEIKVCALNLRSARPGEGNQALHSDYGTLRDDGSYKLVNSMWLVDDFTPENGATRIVPGTHRGGRLPADEMDDPSQPHPDQILLTAKAGTVVIFNGHTWHGGTQNRTDTPRRGLTFAYQHRDEPQQFVLAGHMRQEVLDRLSPAERFLLDV